MRSARSGAALNQVWRVEEGRGFVKHKPNNLLWTLVVVALVLVTFVLVFLGGGLAGDVLGLIGLGDTAAAIWRFARWPAALASAMLIYAVVYYAAPNVEIRHWQWITPGAVFGVLAWLLASAIFFVYVSNFSLLRRHVWSVRCCRDPAHLVVAHERRTAFRSRAERGHRRAPGARPARDLRRPHAAREGPGGDLKTLSPCPGVPPTGLVTSALRR